MVKAIYDFIVGAGSAFDMSGGGYVPPSFLSSSKSAFEVLSDDWSVLCADGQKALSQFEVPHA